MCLCSRSLVFIFVTTPLLTHSLLLYDQVFKQFTTRKPILKASYGAQKSTAKQNDSDVGSPLFLTPLIEKGEYQQAQLKATVQPMLQGVESFSGYITVDKKCGSNIFFWFFKALEGDWSTAPLIAWLEGGPGGSGWFGLLLGFGPFSVDSKGQLHKRPHTWSQNCNVLFIDNPVGTGYSFTENESCYARTGDDVTQNLHNFILQFYKMFPTLAKNKLYFVGISYAGKYIPSLAHYVAVKNKENKGFTVPLAGVGLISPLTDPRNMLLYGDYLYQLGFVDRLEREELHRLEDKVRALIDAGKNSEALAALNQELIGTFLNITGLNGPYNYITDELLLDELSFMTKPETRRSIHVGSREFHPLSHRVYNFLSNDSLNSVAPLLEDLLDWGEIDVLTVHGQLDVITAYPLGENVYYQLKWKQVEEYKKAKRCQYELNNSTIGYYKNAGRFFDIMLRNCGHEVAIECPASAFDFINKLVTNVAGFKCM